MLSPTVGMPSILVPPVLFGMPTALTGGGKYLPDAIRFQNLIQIVFEVPLKVCNGLGVHSRRSLVRFHFLICPPHRVLGNRKRLCFIHRFLPLLVDPFRKLEDPGTFAPPPLQRLPRYYALVRSCAPLRYSEARGATTCLAPFTSGRQVPTFHAEAHITFTPPPCRPPPRQ